MPNHAHISCCSGVNARQCQIYLYALLVLNQFILVAMTALFLFGGMGTK